MLGFVDNERGSETSIGESGRDGVFVEFCNLCEKKNFMANEKMKI